MSRVQFVLATVFVCVAAACAYAQATETVRGTLQFALPPTGVKIETLVAHIFRFDTNNDGRIAEAEFPERMRVLIARGDRNGDHALDAAEVTALAQNPERARTTFAVDNQEINPRSDTPRLGRPVSAEALLEELRLPPSKTTSALAILSTRQNDSVPPVAVEAEVMRRLESILTDEEMTDFKAALARAVPRAGRGAGPPPPPPPPAPARLR